MNTTMPEQKRAGFLGSLRFRYGLALAGLLLLAGYFLWDEYQAYITAYLPVLLVLGVCGGMHFLMHRGHGHGNRSDNGNSDRRK